MSEPRPSRLDHGHYPQLCGSSTVLDASLVFTKRFTKALNNRFKLSVEEIEIIYIVENDIRHSPIIQELGD